jgi:glycosyltransferase involved in cell wall biosynthesis
MAANLPITVLTWARNEEEIMPFFLRHYSFADRIIVWDNGSDDRTAEIVEAHPKAELRTWDTGGVFNEVEHTRVKSEEYRNTGPGWKIVVDTDEFLWVEGGMPGFLRHCHRLGISVAPSTGYDMIAEEMPVDDGESQLAGLVKMGVRSPRYDKMCLFGACIDVRYRHGCHTCECHGNVIVPNKPCVKLLHYHWLSLEKVTRRTAFLASVYHREQQKKMGLGLEVTDSEWQTNRWRHIWEHKKQIIP